MSRMHVMRTGMVALAAVVALGLMACSVKKEAPASGLTSVTLMLNWTPNNHHAGIYAALQNGWYRDEGIDLKIIEPATAGADQVVGSGGADFGISQAESLLPARAAGAPVVSIATLLPHNDSSFFGLASSGIKRPKDFEGRTYGGYGGPLETELLATLMKCDGGDPAKVKQVEVGNIDYLPGMEQKRFDFVWVFEGWDVLRAREVEHKDVTSVKFTDWEKCVPDWYTPVIVANEKTIKERPDLIRKFLKATARGYDLAIANPDQAVALLLKSAPELDKGLVTASAKYHAPKYAAKGKPWGVQETKVWTEFAAFLRKSGLLEKDIPVEAAFTNDFLPKK
ncbi:MAG: ABC transporter substrate-binding protein [Dehalococcoidia bacterium]|nr:ABC transporter substrate-binding protein [Dehalococcoidia bacterium]